MHRISDKDFNSDVIPILNKVFLVTDSTCPSFTDEMKLRILLYPCYGYLNTTYTENNEDEWMILNAIKFAARQINDPGFYLTQLLFNEHAYVNTEEIDALFKDEPDAMTSVLEMSHFWEYRLLSSRGDWAIIVTDVHHAIVVGTIPFMKIICDYIPHYDLHIYDWLDTINLDITSKTDRKIFNFTYEWVKPLLINIYGDARANHLIKESGLTKFSQYLS